MTQLELSFPLTWEYKIIATYDKEVFESICAIIQGHGFSEKPCASNVSKNGKYIPYTVSMDIQSRQQLEALAQDLARCTGVKYLL